ncbi:MAG: hypothetical protein J6Q54_09140, partial [Oscillospiraceae bacterium]|nr:hypothetical protein [Oscillospiraceae bacterium]
NRIDVAGSVDATIVIDSLWSNKQIADTNTKEGGIAFNPSGSTSSLEIFFKGDNRFGNILYRSSSSAYKLCLDGDSDATLTVADKDTTGNYNYWNAAIGSTDSFNDSRGIVINGGLVYAGTTVANDCTAIGAGGNGYGVVTINDGIVTAVCSSSGTAIGGGIGKTSQGGAAEVTINGGTVYAYNFSCSSRGYSNCGVKYIPAAAIGGGSSAQATCNSSTVRITGGTVYAQSVGGTAIGGGSSADNNGGDAIIEISGGTVYAKSISGVIDGQTVPAGAAIGGGTGGDGKKAASVGKGGNATVTIVGGTVVTGSIGGGSTINPNATAGYANVRIDGGTVSGQVIMGEVGDGKTSCTFNMSGGSLSKSPDGYVYKYEDGGAVYMDDPIGDSTVSGGIISGCTAVKGGAVYMKAGTFEVSGTGVIQDCAASDNGGAVYMTAGTFKVSGTGVIQNCTSGGNGGAVYMTDGTFEMSEAGAIQNCTATTNGGAVYLQGGTVNISGGTMTANRAQDGAGAYMAGGTMNISDTAGITGNIASANGGGAYLADGTLSVTGGSIASNAASNGAGVYMGGGTMTVSGTAGITGNTATANGGGAYLANGTLNVTGGSITSNSAAGNGGGAFLSGGKLELSGGEIKLNTALAGGGAYLQNGNVTMSGGTVSENKATAGAGGGMYVSAEGQNVEVLIYSGSFTKNEAATAGGALAVCGAASGAEQINVVIGLHEVHAYNETDGVKTLIPINHDSYRHESCPVIRENVSYQKGGAILVSGGVNTSLSIYCLDETKNRVGDGKDQPSNFMMVEGGKVVVSTAMSMDGESAEGDHEHGETDIENSVYVVGGQVDLYGATSNPDFADAVTVDIPKNDTTSHFEDHRYSDDYYTILYFENFKDPQTGNVSGQYKSYQIRKDSEHTIKGVIYNHPGYAILGWYTDPHASNSNTNHTTDPNGKYEVGVTYTFDGNPIKDLIVYAQWEATGYWVRYDANIQGAVYSGYMAEQPLHYDAVGILTPNGYKYPGHRFIGWKDAEGRAYADGAEVINLTDEKDGVVTLYAQWAVCDHVNHCTYSYEVIGSTQLMRKCSCEGQTILVSVYAQDVTYDGQPHPVQLTHTHPGAWELVAAYFKDGASFDGIPKDAGLYTYTIADPNNSTMTVSVSYTIEKADQLNPPAPTYEVAGNTMTVTAVANSTAVTN